MSDVETKLLSIFQLVNDWLKFAEAKNAGLVLASGASSAGILTYLAAREVPPGWRNWLFTALLFLMVSGVISLLSFLPRLNRHHWLGLIHDWGEINDADNLYYYRDLSKYRSNDLVARIETRYALTRASDSSNESCDIAGQIIANSRIASAKFRMFTVAVVSMLVAIGIIIVGLCVDALTHLK